MCLNSSLNDPNSVFTVQQIICNDMHVWLLLTAELLYVCRQAHGCSCMCVVETATVTDSQ